RPQVCFLGQTAWMSLNLWTRSPSSVTLTPHTGPNCPSEALVSRAHADEHSSRLASAGSELEPRLGGLHTSRFTLKEPELK
ncbi:hypothetical protein KUCAC02_016641, partial [Chaenocephalus aceratus]